MTQQNSPRSLMFVVNNPAFFLSHRLPIALAAKEQGYEVSVATMDGAAVQAIKSHGLTHHVLPMSRSGMNPLLNSKRFTPSISCSGGCGPTLCIWSPSNLCCMAALPQGLRV